MRSVRFCGGDDRVLSCDAAGKVLVVDSRTGAIVTEFLGGDDSDVSCHEWLHFDRGGGAVLLVTASVDKMVVWDSRSGKIVSCQPLPPPRQGGAPAGTIERFDVYAPVGPTTKGKRTAPPSELSVACCTDDGVVYLWTPPLPHTSLVPESDDPSSPARRDDGEGPGTLQDLTALVPYVIDLSAGFKGLAVSPRGDVVAWTRRQILVWSPLPAAAGDEPADPAALPRLEYRGHVTAGESIYGVAGAKVVDEVGGIVVVLEDGWIFKVTSDFL